MKSIEKDFIEAERARISILEHLKQKIKTLGTAKSSKKTGLCISYMSHIKNGARDSMSLKRLIQISKLFE